MGAVHGEIRCGDVRKPHPAPRVESGRASRERKAIAKGAIGRVVLARVVPGREINATGEGAAAIVTKEDAGGVKGGASKGKAPGVEIEKIVLPGLSSGVENEIGTRADVMRADAMKAVR